MFPERRTLLALVDQEAKNRWNNCTHSKVRGRPGRSAYLLLHTVPSAFGSAVVVGSANTSMREHVVSSITGPVLLEPVGCFVLISGDQPLDNLRLQDNSKRDTRAPQTPHDELVELLVGIEVVEIFRMLSLLPRNAGKVLRAL